ncbi:hypothetical protein BKA83DRAFT_4132331 [Pisolithus microcarpus]|nr:hypothetical protein BKA83DRAFT_4132331 [Pisolithus microcarpus]
MVGKLAWSLQYSADEIAPPYYRPSESAVGYHTMISWGNGTPGGGMPEHYIAPVVSRVPPTVGQCSTSKTLMNSTQEAPASGKRLGWECLDLINCGTAPYHFKNQHGITNMGREVELVSLAISSYFPYTRLGDTKDAYTSNPQTDASIYTDAEGPGHLVLINCGTALTASEGARYHNYGLQNQDSLRVAKW